MNGTSLHVSLRMLKKVTARTPGASKKQSFEYEKFV